MKKYIYILFTLLVFSVHLWAEDSSINNGLILPEDYKAILNNIEKEYNKYMTIKSRFIQKDSMGNISKGWFVIDKKGRGRIEYDILPILLILQEGNVLLYDKELKQKSFLPVYSFPLVKFLKKDISFFNKEIKIISIYKESNYIAISMENNDEKMSWGTLTIYFSPLGEVIKWEVEDIKNIFTEVFLLDPIFSNKEIKQKKVFNVNKLLLKVDFNKLD